MSTRQLTNNSCVICGNECSSQYHNEQGLEVNSCYYCWHSILLYKDKVNYSLLSNRNKFSNKPKHISQQVSFLDKFLKNGLNVLDVGCAEGGLGANIKEKHNNQDQIIIDGIEISQDQNIAIEFYSSIYNSLNQVISSNKRYDIIIYSHVLEHIIDIHKEFNNINKILKKDGLLFIEVPNQSGNYKVTLDANLEHIHRFSIRSLYLLLSQFGFDIIKSDFNGIESTRYSSIIRVLAAKKSIDYLTMIKEWKGKVIVWGAGGFFQQVLAQIIDVQFVDILLDSSESIIGNNILGHTVCSKENIKLYNNSLVIISSIDYENEIIDEINNLHSKYVSEIVPISVLLSLNPAILQVDKATFED
ncbi:class I SAM-dependent methyltransferase [Candidatus Woesearchaeota archaeon]|jgi:SAM-dependent methyltransferase|nr:class I SAM-dependent methyltransferase [Candidatus Woesearchaeota archaeon]